MNRLVILKVVKQMRPLSFVDLLIQLVLYLHKQKKMHVTLGFTYIFVFSVSGSGTCSQRRCWEPPCSAAKGSHPLLWSASLVLPPVSSDIAGSFLSCIFA